MLRSPLPRLYRPRLPAGSLPALGCAVSQLGFYASLYAVLRGR